MFRGTQYQLKMLDRVSLLEASNDKQMTGQGRIGWALKAPKADSWSTAVCDVLSPLDIFS